MAKNPDRGQKEDVLPSVHVRIFNERECSTKTNIIKNNKNSSVEYNACIIPGHPKSNGIVRFKISDNWSNVKGMDGSKRSGRTLYRINDKGEITNDVLGYWKSTPSQLFATYLSTTYKRLSYRFHKMNRDTKKKVKDDDTFLIAFFTVIYGNCFLRRCAGMVKHSPRNLSKFLYFHKNNADESTRFLLGQCIFRHSWLQHHTVKPVCAKSANLRCVPGMRRPIARLLPPVREVVNIRLNEWVRNYAAPTSLSPVALASPERGKMLWGRGITPTRGM